MKKLLTTAAALVIATAAQAADDVKLQLQWVTQAQFAGYYVALDKGYYSDEGLNVTILPGGPDIAPPHVLAYIGEQLRREGNSSSSLSSSPFLLFVVV